MNLEDIIMLLDVSQSQEDRYCESTYERSLEESDSWRRKNGGCQWLGEDE